MLKKKILRIIAVSFVILVQCGLNNPVRGMENEENKLNSLTVHSSPLKAAFGFPPIDWQPYTNTSWAPVVFTWFEGDEKLKGNLSIIEIPEDGLYSLCAITRWGANGNGQATPYTSIAINNFINGGNNFSRNSIMPGCESTHNISRVTRLSKGDKVMVSICADQNTRYFLGHFHFQIEKIEDTNLGQQVLFLEKGNSELKQYFSLFQQKFEESQKDISELRKCVTYLQEKNEGLIKTITRLPSVINIEKEKFDNKTSITDKIEMLRQAVCSHNKIINTLKQKANELGLEELEDKNIISVPTQIISEDQVPEYCVSLLLKKDPTIFFPWKSSKGVHKVMYDSEFLSETVLPFNILVKGQEEEVPLLSYVKEQKETDLDVNIFQKGKSNFMEMVSSIENIQGNFWKDKEGISTVPILLKKLNEGDNDKEWVPGWSTLEEDYKKYVSATVLCKIKNTFFPKKYEDIEGYLKDK